MGCWCRDKVHISGQKKVETVVFIYSGPSRYEGSTTAVVSRSARTLIFISNCTGIVVKNIASSNDGFLLERWQKYNVYTDTKIKSNIQLPAGFTRWMQWTCFLKLTWQQYNCWPIKVKPKSPRPVVFQNKEPQNGGGIENTRPVLLCSFQGPLKNDKKNHLSILIWWPHGPNNYPSASPSTLWLIDFHLNSTAFYLVNAVKSNQ